MEIRNVRENEVDNVIDQEEQNGHKFLYVKEEKPITAIGHSGPIEVFYTLVFEE